MKALLSRFVLIPITVVAAGCMVGGTVRPTATPSQVDVAALWEMPENITSRDLFHGAGGKWLAPREGAAFAFVREDDGGYSPGYDVRGSNGTEWSVKLGPEAQSEVAMSRILWALGYHQPPTYYMSKWTMTGGPAGVEQPARFRPRLPDWKLEGDWDWYENDFVGTQPFRGLIVANVLLNNWDWKTSNNKIYAIGGADGVPARRIFVVQDLGASLGRTAYPLLLGWFPTQYIKQGSRNDLDDFEAQGFIERVDGDQVTFDYRGIHDSLLDLVTRQDVVWTTRLMSRLTDDQWRDVFGAAGYTRDQGARYIAKIKSKIAEGLKLAQ